jgi:hypothetical protein
MGAVRRAVGRRAAAALVALAWSFGPTGVVSGGVRGAGASESPSSARTSKVAKNVKVGKIRKAAKSAKARPIAQPKTLGKAGPRPNADDPAEAGLDGKVAFFHLRGQDVAALEEPVLKALRERGLTVVTDLRPVDLPDQFRDLAVTLELFAYLDGTVAERRDHQVRVTLSVRSGYSGRRTARATWVVMPADFPDAVEDSLWKRLGPALRRAHVDAQKPHRHTHAPMQINAGTPIPDKPPG